MTLRSSAPGAATTMTLADRLAEAWRRVGADPDTRDPRRMYSVTCAWCAQPRAAAGLAPRVIGTSTSPDSHGICADCARRFEAGDCPSARARETA